MDSIPQKRNTDKISLTLANYSYHLILASTFIFSVILKIYFIEAQELWLDETYTSFVISLPLPEMINYILHDVHPPIYFLLLKSWASIFGYTPYSLRIFSLVLSCLVPIISYFTAKAIFKDRWNVLLCFLLVLFSTELFDYSVEVRPYMLALVFLSVFFYSYVKILQKPKTLKMHILFSVSGACAFYSHYFSLFVLIPFFIHLCVYTFIEKLPIKKVAISVVFFSVLTVPWLPFLFQQWELRNSVTISMESASRDPNTLSYGFSRSENSLSYYISRTKGYLQNAAFGTFEAGGDNLILRWVMRSLKLFFIIFIILALVRGDRFAILLLLLVLTYITCLFLARKTLFVPRYFLFLSLFIPFFIGIAIHQIKSRSLIRYFSLAVGFLIVFSFGLRDIKATNMAYCKQYNTMVQFFIENYKDGDLIVFHHLVEEVPFNTYAHLSNFKPATTGFPISIYDWWNSQAIKGWSGPIVTQNDLDHFIEKLRSNKKLKRIWLVTQEKVAYDPGLELLKRMTQHFMKFEKHDAVQCNDNFFDKNMEIYLFEQ
jgi:uncharacterized membrane protein